MGMGAGIIKNEAGFEDQKALEIQPQRGLTHTDYEHYVPGPMYHSNRNSHFFQGVKRVNLIS